MSKKINGNGGVDALMATDYLGTAALGGKPLAGTVTGMLSGINTAPSFAVGGSNKINTAISGGYDAAYAVAVQQDGKILLAGYSHSGFSSHDVFALARYNALDGSLDTTFSDDGKVTTAIGLFGSEAFSVIVQNDGKILVAGASAGATSGVSFIYDMFALVRYNSNGTLDSSFSGDGKLTTVVATPPGTDVDDAGYAVALQTDGKILVAGYSDSPSPQGYDFALVRYTSNGALDTTFSGDGKVTTDFNNGNDGVESSNAIFVQTDGKILVVGNSDTSNDFSNSDFALVRYNSNGTLDTSFSGDGKLTTDFSSGNDRPLFVTEQQNGKILVVGGSTSSGNRDFALIRYNSDGSLDTSFSGDGKVTTDFGSGKDTAAFAKIQADGKIIVAGVSIGSSGNSFLALARYNPDGTLDTSFSGDGKATSYFGGSFDRISALTVQADGKILVAGHSNSSDGNHSVFSLARYNADGSLDSALGSTLNNTPTYTENGAATVLDSSVQIIDAELAAAGNYGGASVTLARHGGANAQDVFSGSGLLSVSGGNAVLSGVTIGTVSNGNGTLKITFNANATPARANAALSALAYKNSTDTPPASVQIDWTFSDGNTGAQGTGGALSALGSTTVNLIPVNDPPTGTVTITGLDTQGQTLTASNSLADAEGLGTITYTWKYGASVLGTGNSYLLKASDVGHALTVTASYTDQGGTAESKTSAATGVVGVVLTGNADANTLNGTAGNDSLYGNGGNDTLNGGSGDDHIDGGSGVDTMTGGLGNDVYIADNSADKVVEASNGGTDSVYALASYTLAANVENLFLAGTAASNGTGNALANILSGNSANNTLSGGDGNDTLNGGLGNDTLTGGTGQDIFRFNTAPAAANIDKITDFTVADDTIQLENAIFTQLTTTGVLNAADFHIGTGAADANDFIVYNQTTGALFYDSDGNGAVAAVQIATLGVNLALTNADFVVI